MVVGRRFGPLVAAVLLGLGVLLVRMYQVQIVEHEIWAAEAQNLTRRTTIDPYLRGAITDRHGEVFVQDVRAASIQFVYRDFRREHPLGQVAHAWGALEQRSVSLEEVAWELEERAFALLDSTPAELEAFERGEPVVLAGVAFPARKKGRGRRRARAGDLRFYIRGLLDLEPRQWSRLKRELKREARKDLSWLELAALVGESDTRSRERDLERHTRAKREWIARGLDTSLGRLEELASELEVTGPEGQPAATSAQSFAFLVEALEAKRRAVEDAILVDLFQAAAGFHPGRLEPELLLGGFELSEPLEVLGWSRARFAEWARETRAAWLENWRTYYLPAALIRAELERRDGAAPLEALVGELSLLFTPRPRTAAERREQSRAWSEWRTRDELVVFAELPDLFEGRELAGEVGPVLPHQDPELRALERLSTSVPAALIPFEHAPEVAAARPREELVDWRGEPVPPWVAPASLDEARERVGRLLAWRGRARSEVQPPRPERGDSEELLAWVGELWQARFQSRLRAVLAPEVDPADAARSGPHPLAEGRRKRARKVTDYAVRDRSSRPETLDDDPSEHVVNLLLRFRDDYGGFSILPRTQRLFLALDEDGEPVARDLVGVVRESTLEEVIAQRPERSALARIMRLRVRTEEDRARFDELVEEIYRNDEVHGTSGVEGLCDSALRGVNGYSERIGLQEREEAGQGLFGTARALGRSRIDGLDVELTLDMRLQEAAQYVIEHPVLPSGETWRDDLWFQNPVGAIVLATVDGELLAAASGPKQPHEPLDHRDPERSFTYDRCFHRRQFQPVGSIFKPFVAAYALDRLGLTADTVYSCELREDIAHAGWGKVSCHARWGHHDLSLAGALEHSCNAYFAQVGELYESKERFMEMAHLFGFDRPTGVTEVWDGRGFGEDALIPCFHDGRDFTLTQLHRGGNGLEVLEASPVQVARAVCGLATGRLPRMRLVRSIGGEVVPAVAEDLPLSAEALGVVRAAMRGVVTRGSAKGKGLESELLGFDLAGKTGSADYLPMSNAYRAQLRTPSGQSPAMRKHTWFVGFFPAEAPQAVVVVYLHDVGVTASHSAVHVAAQFLKSPPVQAWARGPAR